MMTPPITLDIWSDMMCPFCFIGKTQLDAALSQLPDPGAIAVRWHSYQLAPHYEIDKSKNAHENLAAYKGLSVATAQELNASVSQMAAQSGLVFDMDRMRWANTFTAHRLLQYAKTQLLDHALEQRLFEAVFSLGEDVDDVATLTRIATAVGLPAAAVTEVLTGTAFSAEVTQDIAQSQALGLRGVPFFLLNGQLPFSGAVGVAAFTQVLTEAYAQWKVTSTGDGASCTLDGSC